LDKFFNAVFLHRKKKIVPTAELPPARPRPAPRPVTPGESSLLSPDSDEGFNIRKNWERAARLTKMRKEATASIASGASEAEAPPESNYPTSGRSEDNGEGPHEEGRGDAGGKGKGDEVEVEVEEEGEDKDQDEEGDEDQDEDQGQDQDRDQDKDKDEDQDQNQDQDEDDDGEGEEDDGEDDRHCQDSDIEHWAFSRMIRHGLDPNDTEVQDVLRHGPPRYEEAGDESDQDTNAVAADEDGESSSADDPLHEYNFNEWMCYIGDPMQEGVQTNFDKLTRYRIRGDREWLPIPEGLRAPRYAPGQDQHADQHVLACSKLGTRSSNFPEPHPPKASAKEVQSHNPPPAQLPKPKPPAAAPAKISAGGSDKPKSAAGNARAAHSPQPKPKIPSAPAPVKISAGGPDKPMSGAGGAKVNSCGLRQTLIGLGMAMEPSTEAVVDESDPSGSDYSETLKDARRRNGGDDDDDDDESEDGENCETGGKRSVGN